MAGALFKLLIAMNMDVVILLVSNCTPECSYPGKSRQWFHRKKRRKVSSSLGFSNWDTYRNDRSLCNLIQAGNVSV